MEIDSLHSFVEQINKLNNEYPEGYLPCPVEILYRGHSKTTYKLLPSIARNRKYSCDVTIFNGERNLIELAKIKLPDIFRDDMKPLELLALLQHYAVPTRLLDVTENALVALYFACCSNFDNDGEVFAFLNNSDHVENAPIINAIAETYKITRGATNYSLDHFYKAALNQPYFTEQRHIFDDNFNGAEWVERCCGKIIFTYAPIRSTRQQIQKGRFILFHNKIIDNYVEQGNKAFEAIIEPISKHDESIKGKYTIKKENKKTILRDLKSCGISEDTLFCDNIDLVCKGIVKKVKKML